jgi:DNA (cytosine-5)-methyltransferase 1
MVIRDAGALAVRQQTYYFGGARFFGIDSGTNHLADSYGRLDGVYLWFGNVSLEKRCACGAGLRSFLGQKARDKLGHEREQSVRNLKLTAIDLFAGAGGFSLAALNLDVEVRMAVENDPHACATYRKNIIERLQSSTELMSTDITQIRWKDLLNKAHLESGECDFLLGGPPCQGFSTHRIKGAGIKDPRNDLLLHYFRAVKAIRPKLFLVENVTGILWPRHSDYLNRFLQSATDANYRVFDPTVLNARDYGVPQNRKRIFILGVRSDIQWAGEWPPVATHYDSGLGRVLAGKVVAWQRASVVFKLPLKSCDPNAVHMQHTPELVKVFRSTPKNGGSRSQSNRVLPCHRKHDGHKDVYGRIDPHRPGPTMTTGCVNPSKGRFLHPTANHAITARHAARFQTFPDDFVFEGGLMAAAQQIGNAVPVLLGEIVIRALVECVLANSRLRAKAAAS